jgi:hypothetical protein
LTDLDPLKLTFSAKKPVLKKPVLPEKPAFNLPAGFFKPCFI